jgi:hypothetical protein
MSPKNKFTRQLLVEGKDDQAVIKALCAKFNIKENFDVIDCEGYSKLIEQLPIRLTKQSDIDTVGIIVDADTDIASRWISLHNLFSKLGFTLPDDLPEKGLIINNTHIRIGLWLMPNNQINGMLEDFAAFLIPLNDQLIPIVKDTLNSIESQHLNNYKPIHRSKAEIHSWLALQETPGTPMGLAITKRYLTTDEEICLCLIDWLKELFL